ncbi:MAG: sulfotransferase domain-containing protein, partial [Pirellulales bacterium]|nr:sulfotransferase domain-containing protein [Pirellulales bacterium]
MPATPYPTFYLAGAPKCGTTSLAAYLATHPKVCLPAPKEPFFWCDDLPWMREFLLGARYEESYLRLYANKSPGQLACDATTMYLYSDCALRNLAAAVPQAKLVLMFRNPVDVAYAYHMQMLNAFQESEPDFESAWDLQTERAKGRGL